MNSVNAAGNEAIERARLLSEQALLQMQGGDRVAAVDLCRAALAQDATCYAAHRLLATLTLAGEPNRVLIERIHRHFRPRTYLEIGIAAGATIALVGEGTTAIGVDPAPVIDRPLPPNVRIVRETSDDFFARHDVKKEFGGLALELAFIDGMHLFEYALRDFINIERIGTPDTKVLLHDCYPLDEISAGRNRASLFWTGDIWKVIVCLRKYRPDLRIYTLASPLTGLGLVRGLDPASTVLANRYEEICEEFIGIPYSAIEADKRAALNLVSGDWETARQLLE